MSTREKISKLFLERWAYVSIKDFIDEEVSGYCVEGLTNSNVYRSVGRFVRV